MTPSVYDPKRVNGVYVVQLDTDLAGSDNVVWAFRDECDADTVVRLLERHHGEGRAWSTYEPLAYQLHDDDLRGYLADCLQVGAAEVAQQLDEANRMEELC